MWLDSLLQWTQHGDTLANYSVPLHRRYLSQPKEPATWENRQAHNLVWYFPLHPHGPVWPVTKNFILLPRAPMSNLHPSWQRHAYKASSYTLLSFELVPSWGLTFDNSLLPKPDCSRDVSLNRACTQGQPLTDRPLSLTLHWVVHSCVPRKVAIYTHCRKNVFGRS